jgi:hypothetical protein
MTNLEMDDDFQMIRPGSVVRVRSISEDGQTLFFELPNGTVRSVSV